MAPVVMVDVDGNCFVDPVPSGAAALLNAVQARRRREVSTVKQQARYF